MVQTGARCAAHASVAAVDVCKRCGRFLCGDCVELVGEDAYCAECRGRLEAPASWVGVAALTTAGAGWLTFGLATFVWPPAGLMALPVPFVALAMALIEGLRIRGGTASRRGRRFVAGSVVASVPLLFALFALVIYMGSRY
jgi:hypothetical protein